MINRAKETEAKNHMHLGYEASRLHSRVCLNAEYLFGSRGPDISGIGKEHFPEDLKVYLRKLCDTMNTHWDMAHSLWKESGRTFRSYLKEKDSYVREHGKGFYG